MPVKELKLNIIERIRKLDVYARKSTLSKTLEGSWTALFKGRGMEFAGYRKYSYGDDANLIDWKASLRAKETLVKEYEEERNLNVFFLVDVSNSMLFTSTENLKCEYVAEMVASLSLAILRAGDAVGMSMFNDKLVTRIYPNIGKAVHYLIIKDLINPQNYGGNFDLKKALIFLMTFLKQKALIIIVSDFIGLKPGWDKFLDIASQRYELIGLMIRDPRDRELPKGTGQYLLEDPFSHEKIYIDVNKYEKKYREYVEKEEAEIAKRFAITKSGFLLLTTDKDFYSPVMTFFKKRVALTRF
jgi:uncharacterized protein (DUF58 family)